jgi:cysteine desulfuration protein SufE
MSESFDDVVETFALLDDWDDRYRFLIELGRERTGLPDELKTKDTKVEGCTSQVWLVGEREGAGRFAFRGDSDAHIVKGLVALLLLLYGGRTPAEILELDARAELGKLDLEGHLSPSRANGLFAMVRRIRALAAAAS